MKKIALLFVFLAFCFPLYAQNAVPTVNIPSAVIPSANDTVVDQGLNAVGHSDNHRAKLKKRSAAKHKVLKQKKPLKKKVLKKNKKTKKAKKRRK